MYTLKNTRQNLSNYEHVEILKCSMNFHKRTQKGHRQSHGHWNCFKERRSGAHMGFSERIDTILNWTELNRSYCSRHTSTRTPTFSQKTRFAPLTFLTPYPHLLFFFVFLLLLCFFVVCLFVKVLWLTVSTLLQRGHILSPQTAIITNIISGPFFEDEYLEKLYWNEPGRQVMGKLIPVRIQANKAQL